MLSILETNILEKGKINLDLVKKAFSKLRDVLDGIEEREEFQMKIRLFLEHFIYLL